MMGRWGGKEPVEVQKKKKMVGSWRQRCNEDKQLRNLSSDGSKQGKGQFSDQAFYVRAF